MKVVYLENYPKDGKHLRLLTPPTFPFDITKGEDWEWGKRHLWCVSPKVRDTGHMDFRYARAWFQGLETSHHRTPEKALQGALKQAKISAKKYLDNLESMDTSITFDVDKNSLTYK